MSKHIVYWIKSGGKNYIGYTTNFSQRLRRHNGEISGGAKYTHGHQWVPHRFVSGFTSRVQALKYEFRLKRIIRKQKNKDTSFDTMLTEHLYEISLSEV